MSSRNRFKCREAGRRTPLKPPAAAIVTRRKRYAGPGFNGLPGRPLIFLALVFLLGSCTGPLPSRVPSTSLPCYLPCWYDITPGKTTQTEAEQILRSLPGLYGFDGSNWEWGTSKTGWLFSPETWHPAHGTLTVKQGIVVQMAFSLPIAHPLTFGQVVAQYGPPEFYDTGYITAYHGPPESDYWTVHLYYFQQGFIVSATAPPERKGAIHPDLEVTGIAVFVPTTLEEYFRTKGFSLDSGFRPQLWTGFEDQLVP